MSLVMWHENVMQCTEPIREQIKLLTVYHLRIRLVLRKLLLRPQSKGHLQCINNSNDGNYNNCRSSYNK